MQVYKSILAPLVEEMLQGYNCTIFAYGRSGSGKTYTMTGERSHTLRFGWELYPVIGLVPRALSHIFNYLESIPNGDPSVRVSFLEKEMVRSYNEELERLRRDLDATITKTGIFIDELNFNLMQNQLTHQRFGDATQGFRGGFGSDKSVVLRLSDRN
ncbi:unnamed protein product [Protopolystoma xenopodis]|uniref:Kinesin motor domain-containing protein n=1 Tax=Protopolystoma xenopodis TaxID=117903 RepID=A0A448XKG4_9PLAT|nr:unnamed protein product [Protopolystoma xenopodis]